jgi:hypothetical protein
MIPDSFFRYGTLEHIPWSVLGFRLIKGDDKMDCVAVKVEGTFHGEDLTIKVTFTSYPKMQSFTWVSQGIWPHKQPNLLVRYPTKHTSGRQTQFQIGFNAKANALVSFSLTDALEHSFETGQRLDTMFEAKRFEVSLSIDKHSPRGTCVADLVEFFVLVELNEKRMPMTLEVAADVTYRHWGRKKVVPGR